MMGKSFQQTGCVDINDIEFKIIKSPRSVIASAEVGVEARHCVLNITVQSTSYRSQYQNMLATIELIKKQIGNKS
ncbi:hypothetical protein Q4490_02930 [Neptunomonas phycophila]|uniref:Uncharacterized protein n=1 Tax=Neptunomonas phycophila TaxID=1572645 RepID=A0AAW7XET8_9GAMM|nr:hypothetical protein [Neptunomonas phycophila]MDO6452510.1 hypothetical protein [Neptunomonas phycophila]